MSERVLLRAGQVVRVTAEAQFHPEARDVYLELTGVVAAQWPGVVILEGWDVEARLRLRSLWVRPGQVYILSKGRRG